jgi:amino acid transporter
VRDQIRKLIAIRGVGKGSAAAPSAVSSAPTGNLFVDALAPLGDVSDSAEKTDNAVKLIGALADGERRVHDARAEASAKIITTVGSEIRSTLESTTRVLKPLATFMVAMAVVAIMVVIVVYGLHVNLRLSSIPLWGKIGGLLALASAIATAALKAAKWGTRAAMKMRQLWAARNRTPPQP